jgi:hypothetical protein
LIEELEHVTSQATKIQTRLARLPSLEDLAADPDWILEGPVEGVQVKLRRSGLRVIVEEGNVEEIIIEA